MVKGVYLILHVDGGICFKCNGSKFQEVTELEYKVWELNEKKS